MQENFHRKKHLTSFQMIILGFAGVILLGTLLLMLPVSSADGIVTPFDEALFTSTSAVCVTGLVVQDTGSYWSGFGQTVILILIQTGGLGSSDSCCRCIYAFRKKNISYATQHYAERNIGTAGRRNCPVDKIHTERNFFWLRRLEQFYFSRYFAMILGGGESGCPYFIQYLHFAMPGLTYWNRRAQVCISFRIWR